MDKQKANSVNKTKYVISVFCLLQLTFACKTNKSIATADEENKQDSTQESQKNYQTRFNVKETTTNTPAQTITAPNTVPPENKNTGARPR